MLQSALENLDGTAGIADDVMVYGVGDTYQEALTDHDVKVRNLLLRCGAKNIKVNLPKCMLSVTQMVFSGHLFTNEGL